MGQEQQETTEPTKGPSVGFPDPTEGLSIGTSHITTGFSTGTPDPTKDPSVGTQVTKFQASPTEMGLVLLGLWLSTPGHSPFMSQRSGHSRDKESEKVLEPAVN